MTDDNDGDPRLEAWLAAAGEAMLPPAFDNRLRNYPDRRAAIDRIPEAALAGARVEVVAQPVDSWVVLDRCEDLPVEQTEYCVHGQATCALCRAWCWLGSATQAAVAARRAAPVCRPCAAAHVPAGTRAVQNLDDHRRADGPH